MDPTRFDRLTTRLATAQSRRTVLTALGGALGGALALRLPVHAAPLEACRQAYQVCSAQATAPTEAAIRACRTQPAAQQGACLAQAQTMERQALQACESAYRRCLETPVGVAATCQAAGQPCDQSTACCPGLTCGRPSPFDPGRCR